MQRFDSTSPLAAYLAISYALLIVYACLHPLTGWRLDDTAPLAYLFESWPRYLRTEDIVVNILGYIPLGFVLMPALTARASRKNAFALTVLLGALLSLSVETTQSFLPSRVANNIDLGNNVLGTLIGAALGSLWGQRLFRRDGWLHRWRSNVIIDGRGGDAGLILGALWLLTQLKPDAVLFATGDLRRWLGVPVAIGADPNRLFFLEMALVATSLVALCLMLRCVMRRAQLRAVLLVLLLGAGAKTLASWSFLVPGDALVWLTSGVLAGIATGLVALLLAWHLPPVLRHGTTGMTLLVATVLANLTPDNPLVLIEQHLLDRGNFLNFHGLTRVVAGTWPFLALAFLSALGLWRGEHMQRSTHDRPPL